MSQKTARNQPTSHDLKRGRAAAEDELQQAREEHARAAYAHAINREDATARDAVLASKRRMDLLQSEMQGLDAAAGEAKRLEALDALDADVASLQQQRNDALRAVASTNAAFDRMVTAIKELHKANTDLEAAEAHSNGLESRCAQLPDGQPAYSLAHRSGPLVDGLLWWAVGERDLHRSEVVMDVGGRVNVENAGLQYKRQGERARLSINEGIDRKVEAIGGRSAALKAKGR